MIFLFVHLQGNHFIDFFMVCSFMFIFIVLILITYCKKKVGVYQEKLLNWAMDLKTSLETTNDIFYKGR